MLGQRLAAGLFAAVAALTMLLEGGGTGKAEEQPHALQKTSQGLCP
jgi:hypothetical protein